MPPWTSIEGWMKLGRLDDGEGLDGAYVLAFKITDAGTEKWSSRMNRFKDRDKEALYGAAACLKKGVPSLLQGLDLEPQHTLFVPAISSRREIADEAAFLTLLTKVTATSADAAFDREAVQKEAHQPLHGFYDAVRRTAELEKANYVARRVRGIRHVVIVDDLITRGGTMSRMAQALKASNSGVTVHGVALGKTERRSYWGEGLTNDHVDARWDDLWLRGERKYRER